MTKSIECIDCGTPVPYGRLACPACGALLASVGRRPAMILEAATESASEPESSVLSDDDASAWPSSVNPVPVGYRPSGLSHAGVAARGWPAASVPGRVVSADPTRFAEIAGWYVVVGATMAVLGFLLPWSRVTGTYFESWGLAGSTHLVVLAATLIVLALGILRSPVPVWLRSGVFPLALGSLVIGLAWPYAIGPLKADVGIAVLALGGLAMVIGGVVTTWATRHEEADPLV